MLQLFKKKFRTLTDGHFFLVITHWTYTFLSPWALNSYYYADFIQNDVFFQKSSYPKITKLYDRIPSHIKNTYDYSEFKERLSTHLKPKKIKLFNYGSRYSNTLHTQLRLDRSQLNEHLFSIGLTNIKGCMCGHNNESTKHFLLYCLTDPV